MDEDVKTHDDKRIGVESATRILGETGVTGDAKRKRKCTADLY